MAQPNEYGFDDRLLMSNGVASKNAIELILMDVVPGAVAVKKANLNDDKSGVDYWVQMQGRWLGVDVKIRARDFGQDDLALETWSVKGSRVGWTRDQQKKTDYILWYWEDSRRYVLLPFPMLCKAFIFYFEVWVGKYRVASQRTRGKGSGWESECVFVPRTVVWDAIYALYGSSKTKLRQAV